MDSRSRGRRVWLIRSSGGGAAVGALAWAAAPWLQAAVLGTRPYVGTVFDLLSLCGWLLVAAGLAGFRAAFRDRYGRIGRVAVGVTAAGVALVGGLLVRSTVAFVAAGFDAVPATGEDPAGLVLTFVAVSGLTLTVAGAGGIGLALRRLDGRLTPASGLLLAAPVVPAVVVTLRGLSVLPLAVGALAVRTNAVLVPFALAWAALGLRVRAAAG